MYDIIRLKHRVKYDVFHVELFSNDLFVVIIKMSAIESFFGESLAHLVAGLSSHAESLIDILTRRFHVINNDLIDMPSWQPVFQVD